jgi:hypothetical protein
MPDDEVLERGVGGAKIFTDRSRRPSRACSSRSGNVHFEIFTQALKLMQEALDQLLPHRCNLVFLVFFELVAEGVRDVSL